MSSILTKILYKLYSLNSFLKGGISTPLDIESDTYSEIIKRLDPETRYQYASTQNTPQHKNLRQQIRFSEAAEKEDLMKYINKLKNMESSIDDRLETFDFLGNISLRYTENETLL